MTSNKYFLFLYNLSTESTFRVGLWLMDAQSLVRAFKLDIFIFQSNTFNSAKYESIISYVSFPGSPYDLAVVTLDRAVPSDGLSAPICVPAGIKFPDTKARRDP